MPAQDTMRPCSSWLLALPMLWVCSLPGQGMAQAPAPPPASPTQPEKQQPLNVDRDPVASPDPVGTAPTKETAPPGAIGRGENGRYTLQRNVDEGVLNVTVLDPQMHLVTTLTKDDFKVFEDGAPQSITSFQHQDIP